MAWKNYTDLPNATLKRIYRQVCPNLGPHDVVAFDDESGDGYGVAMDRGSGPRRVLIAVPRTDAAAQRTGWRGRLEVFTWLLAHELRHLWWAEQPDREYDANGYASMMVRVAREKY